MKKLLLIFGLSLGLVGCGPQLPTQMNIEKGSSRPEYLMGEITRAEGYSFKKINLKVENLKKSCEGQSLDGQFQIMATGVNDSYKHKFPITCSDGSKGMVMLKLTTGGGLTGSGYGEMDDGSIVKINVGKTGGGLTW